MDESTTTTSATSSEEPNYEYLQCRGQVKVDTAGLTLTLKSLNVSSGKWTINPPATLTGPTAANWMAQGRSSAAVGAEGSCVYQTPDGAEIVMWFDVPYIGDNKATITSSGATSGKYTISVSPVPSGGDQITPVYTVNNK